MMKLPLARVMTPEEAHSSLGTDGINRAVTNCQAAMSSELGREVTRAEAHSSWSRDGGNRTVELAGTMRLERSTRATMSELAMMGRCPQLIDVTSVKSLGVSMWRQEPI